MTDTKKNSALADPVPAKMTDEDLLREAQRCDLGKYSKGLWAGYSAELAAVLKYGRAIESRALSSAAPQEPDDRCPECGFIDWRDFYTGPKKTHDVCATCSYRRPAAAPAQPQEQPAAAQQDECFCDKSAPYSCTPCWNGMQAPQQEAAQSAPAQPTVPEGFALVPRKATEGMIRAAFGWRESDSRAGLIGDADMYERIYYAMISAALASSPDVPGEWERLLTQVIPYRLKLIERGECVDASVEAIRECVARLLASAPAQPTVPEGALKEKFRQVAAERVEKWERLDHEDMTEQAKADAVTGFGLLCRALDEIAAAAPVAQGEK